MATRIKVDNDTWTARLGGGERRGFLSVVFFCASNGQRPWRVVEVPEDRFASQEQLDGLSEDDLRKLFATTVSMGAPRTYG
jgi:hypothetical protein